MSGFRRTCVHCFRQVVACTMGGGCSFSGWVHERSRLHQCHPLGIAGKIYRPYAYGRRPEPVITASEPRIGGSP
jgi:hypothetical protein